MIFQWASVRLSGICHPICSLSIPSSPLSFLPSSTSPSLSSPPLFSSSPFSLPLFHPSLLHPSSSPQINALMCAYADCLYLTIERKKPFVPPASLPQPLPRPKPRVPRRPVEKRSPHESVVGGERLRGAQESVSRIPDVPRRRQFRPSSVQRYV